MTSSPVPGFNSCVAPVSIVPSAEAWVIHCVVGADLPGRFHTYRQAGRRGDKVQIARGLGDLRRVEKQSLNCVRVGCSDGRFCRFKYAPTTQNSKAVIISCPCT